MFDGKEYVYAVYEEKSFSKAAQKLYITQPALSTAIKKVEKKIGTPIFDRSTSPIGLTPGGEVYIDAIEKLFALEQNTLNQLNNLNGLLAGKLSVGGTIFFTSFVLPGVLSEFSHRYPQIKIDLQEGTTTQLTDKLVAEELDLLIDNSELDDKNYEKYYYSTERIILAVPKSFPINEELTQYQLTAEDIRAGRHSQAVPGTAAAALKEYSVYLRQRGKQHLQAQHEDVQPPELFAEYYHETGPGCLCVQHGRTGRGRDLHPGWPDRQSSI